MHKDRTMKSSVTPGFHAVWKVGTQKNVMLALSSVVGLK